MSSLIRKIGGWVLPYEAFVHIQKRLRFRRDIRALPRDIADIRAMIAPNAAFRGIHRGQRCFVLCNGPTVAQQEILPLAGEIVISVSSGYHHPDFAKIRPRYHCVTQITFGQVTEADVVRWFQEMHEKLGDAELFLSYTEEALVKRHNLFPGRKVHYVFFYELFDSFSKDVIPDIAGPIPHVQSVAIMALIIALYMGFDKIFLLGTDHDHFRTGVYKYFYEPTVLKGKDLSVAADGHSISANFDLFVGMGRLWQQYRALREIAETKGIRIWNATAGGELDELPRMSLQEALASRPRTEPRMIEK